MNSKICIREYSPKDKPHVIGLLRLNTPEYFSHEEEKELDYYLEHEIEHYFVVECDGIVVGSGGFNFSEDKKTGKISWDILHPNYQSQGIGSQLLNYRMHKFSVSGDVRLIMVRTSQLVYRFYEKRGFQLMEIQKDYWAKGFDLYRMEYKSQK